MNNPFEEIETRLSSIENLLLDLKKQSNEVEGNLTEQLLTVPEAASFLKLSAPTIYSKVSSGELPHMKRGNRLYFSTLELLEYLKTGRKKTNGEIEAEVDSYLEKKGGLND